MNEHEKNVCTILQALCDAWLYVNPDKTHLFCVEIDFLGHGISACGIKADSKKIEHILTWPQPKSASEVHGFLGLICHVAAFLPSLADHAGILTKLTMKDSEQSFLLCTPNYQIVFDTIRQWLGNSMGWGILCRLQVIFDPVTLQTHMPIRVCKTVQ